MKKLATPIRAEKHLGNSIQTTRLWIGYGGEDLVRLVVGNVEIYVSRSELVETVDNTFEQRTCLKQA